MVNSTVLASLDVADPALQLLTAAPSMAGAAAGGQGLIVTVYPALVSPVVPAAFTAATVKTPLSIVV